MIPGHYLTDYIPGLATCHCGLSWEFSTQGAAHLRDHINQVLNETPTLGTNGPDLIYVADNCTWIVSADNVDLHNMHRRHRHILTALLTATQEALANLDTTQ